MPAHGSVVLGGRGVPSGLLQLPERVHHLGSMCELAGFARGMLAVRNADPAPPPNAAGV
jgi:hypothetical protein